jgi:hypothetical protein
VIVACIGYQSMNEAVAGLVDREVADAVGPCWGLGSGVRGDPGPWLGELRNMWKPTAHEALWFHGGNLALSRFYSRYLALQLKARHGRASPPPSTAGPNRSGGGVGDGLDLHRDVDHQPRLGGGPRGRILGEELRIRRVEGRRNRPGRAATRSS